MTQFNLLCVAPRHTVQLTSGEQAVRRWWQRAYYADDFDEYYEESQYARRELLLPLRRLPWP